MSTSASPVASSSRRLSSTSAPPAKRPRQSDDSNFGDDDGMSDAEPSTGDLDHEAREKQARKEARTIRNRESAQRSRNQRKAHLIHLEQRVAELEAENRALRAPEYSTPARASSSERECSPAQSVLSIAQDLGIAPEIVSSSGGVHLATVAPPPADVDVKPVIPASPLSLPALPPTSVEQLTAENQGLKERVGLLTNLVRQLVALTNLDSTNLAAPVAQPSPHLWQTSAVAPTLSPNLFPTLPTQLPQSVNEMSLACHPAAGEESFTFGTIGNEHGAFGNDGKSHYTTGQSAGNVVPFPFELENGNNTSAIEQVQTFEVAENETTEVAAEWDEGMRALLEDLEGRQVDVVEKNEVVQGGEEFRRGVTEEWWFGRTNDMSTALGLAM